MDNITLGTINNSIEQLNCRIDDLNNRVDENNSTMRMFNYENNKAHRTIEKQIDQACRLISNVEKKSALTEQRVDNHLKLCEREDSERIERKNIYGVTITSLFSNFICAAVGALVVLYTTGTI